MNTNNPETEQIYNYEKLLSELNTNDSKPIGFKDNKNEYIEINGRNAKFFRINELSVQEQYFLRHDLESVFAGFNNENFSIAYVVIGKPSGVDIFIGVINNSNHKGDIHTQSELLKSQLEGNISGIDCQLLTGEDVQENLIAPLQGSKYFGLIKGIPSLRIDEQAQSQGKTINQGIDRLARTLVNERWQMLIVAKPTNINVVNEYIEDILNLSSELHHLVKYSTQVGYSSGWSETKTKSSSNNTSETKQAGTNKSESTNKGSSKQQTTQTGASQSDSTKINDERSQDVGKSDSKSHTKSTNEGTTVSEGVNHSKSTAISTGNSQSNAETQNSGHNKTKTLEFTNKKLERVNNYINETLIKRLEIGRSNGFFQTAVYVCAKESSTYDRLSAAFMSIFQGNQSYFNPLTATKIHVNSKNIAKLFSIQWDTATLSKDASLITSTPYQDGQKAYASWLSSSELALLAGLPSREVCGVRLRKNVEFSVNPTTPSNEGFEIGKIILNGLILKQSKVFLDKKTLNQHVFVSGVTGAGKTTTCQQLLFASELPFLVIEPAKTEYRSLYEKDKSIEFYTLNNENISPFRLNPFEILPSQYILSHIDMLKATFAAVFPMEASMPYLIEEAIVKTYEAKGWDIHTTTNYLYEDPWNCNGEAFPIMSELLVELEKVIESKKFGLELQEKYRGSLISRLDNLTVGSKGRMLNTRRSVDVVELINKKVVIELDELKDEQDKALIMGLLIGRVAEAVKYAHSLNHNFRHLTLIEEAHRLLEKPSPNDDGAKKMGVSLFSNLLAEVRKYGEGLIIADQIPNKLAPEVLKNTNTKIVHRLFAADDRKSIGDTIGLDEDQCNFLPMLSNGEAIIYSAGWHGAVRTQVNLLSNTSGKPLNEEIIAKHSRQRIFNQRERLYPELSSIWPNECPSEFFKFIQQGTQTLNFWVKWFEVTWNRKQKTKSAVNFNQRIKINLDLLYSEWENTIEVDHCLTALFIDIAPIPFKDELLPKEYNLSEIMHYLFSLYHKGSLDEKPVSDNIAFNLSRDENDNSRIIINAIDSIFKNITSI